MCMDTLPDGKRFCLSASLLLRVRGLRQFLLQTRDALSRPDRRDARLLHLLDVAHGGGERLNVLALAHAAQVNEKLRAFVAR